MLVLRRRKLSIHRPRTSDSPPEQGKAACPGPVLLNPASQFAGSLPVDRLEGSGKTPVPAWFCSAADVDPFLGAPVSSPGRMNTGLLAGVSAVLAGLVILAGIYITHRSAPTMASMPSSSPPVVIADNRAKTESPISRSTPAPVAATRTPAIERGVPVAQQRQDSEPSPPAQESSVTWLVAAGAIVLLTVLMWRTLKRKQRQQQINNVAGAVASYFRDLGRG